MTRRLLVLAACLGLCVVAWHAVDIIGWAAANLTVVRFSQAGGVEFLFRNPASPK